MKVVVIEKDRLNRNESNQARTLVYYETGGKQFKVLVWSTRPKATERSKENKGGLAYI